MRILEVFILLSELVLVGLFTFKNLYRFKNRKYLRLLPLMLIALHLLLEGPRWQMYPAYFVGIVLAIVGWTEVKYAKLRFLKIFCFIIGLLLLMISGALSYILPVFKLPAPTGGYAVGTTNLHLIDPNRPETIPQDTTDNRELMVRVWYPAEPKHGKPVSYMPKELASTISEINGTPGFFLAHFNLIETHAYEGASISKKENTYPIVIFSHGYKSNAAMYTALSEDLASHGYYVFSINYTYENPLSIFPGDRYVYFDPDYTDVWKGVSWDSVEASFEAVRDSKNAKKRNELIKKYLTVIPFTKRINLWKEDISFLIGALNSKEQMLGNPIFSRMDIDNIAAVGHSVGGAASAIACAYDSRIKAGINMDGSQWGSLMDTTLTQPFLWLTANRDPVLSSHDIDSMIYENVTKGPFYELEIAGANHSNFYEIALWSNLRALTQTGTIDGHRMIEVLNQGILTFLDKHLKEEPIQMDVATQYPEVTLRWVMNTDAFPDLTVKSE